ncbi:MAG: Mu-like prophage major head subunit gpT family protein [Nitratireductor sp.]
MLIEGNNMDALFKGFQGAFNRGFQGAKATYPEIALITNSTTSEEVYPWLGQFPSMRAWVGDRVVNGLVVHDFKIPNQSYEQTISVPRTKIEDDKYGIYAPFFEEMGKSARDKPEELVYSLLSLGFEATCYDGQYFFDTDHPVIDETGLPQSVSNMQSGSSTPWFLLDCSRAMRPLIWQERIPFNAIDRRDKPTDSNVFDTDNFVYGVRGRGSAGFGLWQLAFGSKAPLTAANYEAARSAMQALRGDGNRPLGVKPTHLVVPPSLEGAAMRIINNGTRTETVDDGSGGTNAVAIQNEWANTAKLIVSPWL